MDAGPGTPTYNRSVRGRPDVAMIAADELRSLQETMHLLRSPANARRITQEHRLVYRVTRDRLAFLQARFHYTR